MIFQLGKTKTSAQQKLDSDARWRQPSFVRVNDDAFSEERIRAELEEMARSNGEEKTVSAEEITKPVWTAPVDITSHRVSTGKSLDDEALRRFGTNVKTAIAPGTIIEGRFSFDSPVRIDGELTGEISSTSVLIVGEQATVKAKIKVGSIIIFGKVVGDLEAQDLVEIKNGGHLEANISTDRIAIEEGAYFKGSVNIA